MVTDAAKSFAADRSCVRDLALAAVATLVNSGDAPPTHPEIEFLMRHRAHLNPAGRSWSEALLAVLREPAPADAQLSQLAAGLKLSPFEVLTVALAAAVDDDAWVGRALARVQTPVGGARPTLGLLASAFANILAAGESPFAVLLNGPALHTGLLTLLNDGVPLPERALAVPAPLCLALAGQESAWPGVSIGSGDGPPLMLPASTVTEGTRQAQALARHGNGGLILRAAAPAEGRAAASHIARVANRRPAFIETDKLTGLGPWLRLQKLLPVFVYELGPSERRMIPALPGYEGPVLAVAGPDGGVEAAQGALPDWRLRVPPAAERATLWTAALGESAPSLAGELANHHRHGAGRIAQVGRLARHCLALRNQGAPKPALLDEQDVVAASWIAEGGGLDSLAEPLRAPVPEKALVVPPALHTQLELLAARCQSRDGLVEGLGPAAMARYQPGVRALFTGPSGTGKTLAAGWLATRLKLPLYRVDLASVTSKYIGETEKNLAQLLARAEQAEVILLFDEADSLFGKRTDIRDSNDRFANAQTNYLLQRIESYDGIVLLTSNSRVRFDGAFMRRLDCVLEFHLPSPEERRELWRAHLGGQHSLAPAELNQLAALADVAGGHIRNAVLAAALRAHPTKRKITLADCVNGLDDEFRKLGRQMPSALKAATASVPPPPPKATSLPFTPQPQRRQP